MKARHIAFIMDGNGRWANKRNLNRTQGHLAGYKVLEPLVRYAVDIGVQELTFFAMSCENYLHRPEFEVNFLLKLLCRAVHEQAAKLLQENIALDVIGDVTKLPRHVQDSLSILKENSLKDPKLTIHIAINYSGQWHLSHMAKCWQEDGCLDDFATYMSRRNSDIDILVRTGKEQRISNSFLWQIAYAELFFPDVYWPDFNVESLEEILSQYKSRQRRFGRTPCQIEESAS